MAIFRPGPIIGAISGNLGSINFVLGKYGPYLRTALQRVKGSTQLQAGRRARMQQVSRAWRAVPEPDRKAWNEIARSIRVINRLGIAETITGYQLFIGINTGRRHKTDIVSDVPWIATKTFPPRFFQLSASAAGTIEVDFLQLALQYPSGLPGGYWYFYGARSRAPVNTWSFKNWVYVGVRLATNGQKNRDLTGDWDATLGHPTQGELIAIRMKTYANKGLMSTWVNDTAITTA